MNTRSLLPALSLAAGCLWPVADAEAAPPLEAYGALPAIESVTLAPSGQRFAALMTVNGQRVVSIFDTNQRLLRQINVGDIKVRGLQFVADDMLMIRHSATATLPPGFNVQQIELYQAMIVPLAGGAPVVVFRDKKDMIHGTFGFYGIRVVDGAPKGYFGGIKLKMSSYNEGYEFDSGSPGLYEVDLRTGETKMRDGAGAQSDARDWLIGPDGKIAARLETSSGTGNWFLRDGKNALVAKGASVAGQVSLLSGSADGRGVLLSVREPGASGANWYTVALDGNGAMTPFLDGTDVEYLTVSDQTGFATGYKELGGSMHYFDPVSDERANAMRAMFVGREPWPVDVIGQFEKALVATSGTGDSGSYYLVDVAAKRADNVASSRPSILSTDVGKVSRVSYKAGDGLGLDGILTLPPGRDAKALPVVVLPHGGPRSADNEEFDWWAQAFASQGYAVFQPNFRGSTGKGSEFVRAGDGEWGKKMQTDISDGVAYLAAQGIIDSKRACIVGASYGGYAALAGVTLQQGIYRCAVAVAGISDVGAMSRLDQRESNGARVTQQSLGEMLGPKEGFRAISPKYAAANANAPIMLIHGKDDTVVAFEQSKMMADALKAAGKPYEFVTLNGEDHWLSTSTTRLQMLRAAVAFVTKHNPPA